MPVRVSVRVRVNLAGLVTVAMSVNQVGAFQQSLIPQQLRGFTMSGDFTRLEDEAVIRDVFNQSQVVRCRNHRLAAIAPTDQQIDDLALALGVERRRGLIEQQHFGIEYQNRRQRDSFLFAAGELVRRAVLQMPDLHQVKRPVDPAHDFIFCPSELQRRKRDFIEDGRVEKLDIGVLKYQPNPASKIECVFFVNDTPTTEIYTLSLHDALPILCRHGSGAGRRPRHRGAASGRSRGRRRDRKSTCLNSSHITISYAVFCLKKKKTKNNSLHVSQKNETKYKIKTKIKAN